jgi:hypothetical protein
MEKPLRQKTITEEFQALKKESDWYKANEKNIANAFNAASMDPAIARLAIDKILASAPNSAPLAMIAAKHLLNHGTDGFWVELERPESSVKLAIANLGYEKN